MSTTKETIYAQGLRFFNPRETAPEFVKGEVIVNLKEFFDFVSTQKEYYTEYQGNKQLKLNMLSGKQGMYFTVDTFKPNSSAAAPQKVALATADDLPF
tara:strand:+ start:701 stop:994 length:294 start_codon:yes stop_codon:yes gene_type:complete